MVFMPESLETSQELHEALSWLKEQPGDLPKLVSDSSLALKMYKKKKKEEEETSFGASLENLEPRTKIEPEIPSPSTEKNSFNLDLKSKQALEETSLLLNLSSDDALRALIQLGFSNLKKITS